MRVSVAEFISGNPVTIRAAQSARAAAKLMRDKQTEFLVVLDGENVVGVVTPHDLATRVLAPSGTGDMRIDQVCTREPVTASPSDSLLDVLDVMRERQIGTVPIVEDGRLLGVFSIDDLGTERDRGPVEATPELGQAAEVVLPGNVVSLPTGPARPSAKSTAHAPSTNASA
ncbi:hypothetical protein GCM10028820_14010 [Tessaracoccus terricola]